MSICLNVIMACAERSSIFSPVLKLITSYSDGRQKVEIDKRKK